MLREIDNMRNKKMRERERERWGGGLFRRSAISGHPQPRVKPHLHKAKPNHV